MGLSTPWFFLTPHLPSLRGLVERGGRADDPLEGQLAARLVLGGDLMRLFRIQVKPYGVIHSYVCLISNFSRDRGICRG
jgi:hypothetical protein